jgi:Undecaprenyl-phosphate galactose phosphotransferase WbaP
MLHTQTQEREEMTAEHRARLASANLAAQRRPNDIDEDSGVLLGEARIIASDLHIVKGDGVGESARSQPNFRANDLAKRAFDLVTASCLCLLLSPLVLVIVVLIRLEGEPILFRHKRIGRNGRMFHCIKFRTMVPNAEEVLRHLLNDHPELRDEWTENHKLRNDPRVSAIGRVLRLTSLDELPQLWNVLRGDMSLVGPRPVVRAELLRYGRDASRYQAVKPGLTGLWQVKGRSDTTYRRRVAMDRFYVRNQSIFLDIYILAVTPAAVLRRSGAY